MFSADEQIAIKKAVQTLHKGGLVAVPTETVYGLAADATNEKAIKNIYQVKGRPLGHPLILHIADAKDMALWAENISENAYQLANAFWPGPLTLLLKRSTQVLDIITGGRDTVAIRVPLNRLTQEVIKQLEKPIAAPSANRFGRVSPTTADHVRADLGEDVNFILDGGPCSIGLESTIIDMTTNPPTLLRAGGIGVEAIESVIGQINLQNSGEAKAPGMLESHYAPRARVKIIKNNQLDEQIQNQLNLGLRVAVLAMKAPTYQNVISLDLGDCLEEAAKLLYVKLRQADEQSIDVINAILPEANHGLGRAIQDRIRKAAH